MSAAGAATSLVTQEVFSSLVTQEVLSVEIRQLERAADLLSDAAAVACPTGYPWTSCRLPLRLGPPCVSPQCLGLCQPMMPECWRRYRRSPPDPLVGWLREYR